MLGQDSNSYFFTIKETIIRDIENDSGWCRFLIFVLGLSLTIIVYMILCAGGLGVYYQLYSDTYDMKSGCQLDQNICDNKLYCYGGSIGSFLRCGLISILAILAGTIGLIGIGAITLVVFAIITLVRPLFHDRCPECNSGTTKQMDSDTAITV